MDFLGFCPEVYHLQITVFVFNISVQGIQLKRTIYYHHLPTCGARMSSNAFGPTARNNSFKKVKLLVCTLLAASLIEYGGPFVPGVYSVDRGNFKTCNEASFCRRLRGAGGGSKVRC